AGCATNQHLAAHSFMPATAALPTSSKPAMASEQPTITGFARPTVAVQPVVYEAVIAQLVSTAPPEGKLARAPVQLDSPKPISAERDSFATGSSTNISFVAADPTSAAPTNTK